MNERPFSHVCRHGTRIEANRCDFVGGVTAYVSRRIDPERLAADMVELGAWHRANIVPLLNGYTGPDEITLVYE